MAEIFTTKGLIEESTLVKTEGEVDTDIEHTTWTEYRLNGELVRRDVHVRLKTNVTAEPAVEGF